MSSPLFRIRQAALADVPLVAEVHVLAWQQAYAGRMPQDLLDGLRVSDRVASWQRILEAEARPDAPWRSWVAEDDEGHIVGFISIGPGQDEDGQGDTELYALYLLEHAYGSGAGQALLDAASAFSRPLSLWVLDDNPRAQAFYLRNGFTFDGAEKQDPHGTAVLHELRMTRPAL